MFPDVGAVVVSRRGRGWICLNIAAMAPDGHNVLDDNSGYTQSWRITGQSPEAGMRVAENETVTFEVSR